MTAFHSALKLLTAMSFMGVVLINSSAQAAETIAEIVVTAQKRSESLSDVPISITALTGRDLQERALKSADQLVAFVPNLQMQHNQGSTGGKYYLRGIGDGITTANGVAGVGIFVDEVYLNSNVVNMFSLFDLERVEVLRGPQNTLYGRNTTGGAINFVTRRPEIATLRSRFSSFWSRRFSICCDCARYSRASCSAPMLQSPSVLAEANAMATLREGNSGILLVVDVQTGVMSQAWDAPRIIKNVARAVERARAKGVPVIWVQHSNHELPVGSPQWKWVPELAPAEGESLIHKEFNSAFEKTTLDEVLARLGATHISLAGAATNWCIRATAYGALDRGYDLTLIKDAHTTATLALDNGTRIEAASVVDELNIAMTWLAYPGRSNGVAPADEVDFATPGGSH